MKKRHLFSILILLLVLFIFGLSFAMYVHQDADQTINIGVNTASDGNLTLTLGSVTGTLVENDEVGEEDYSNARSFSQSTRVIPFTAGFTKSGNSTYTQATALGKLEIVIETASTTLQQLLYIQLENSYSTVYGWNFMPSINGNQELLNYWDTEGGKPRAFFDYNGKAENATLGNTSTAWSGNTLTLSAYIWVPTSGIDYKIILGLGLDKATVNEATLLTVAEASYTVDINFTNNITAYSAENTSGYKFAYVVGTMNGWAKTDAYRMCVNLGAENWEWMWQGSIDAGQLIKCTSDGNPDLWSAGADKTVPANLTGVYWTGSEAAELGTSTT